MKPFRLLPLFAVLVSPSAARNPFEGRWDITITPQAGAQNADKGPQASAPYPDWMEVAGQEAAATVRIQPRSGGAREIKDFKLTISASTWLARTPQAPRPVGNST